uniref:Uncharacterized protein n=1 Tax=Arundo donax TaxID=35708 RepID=A0A0A9FY95_ARUDO
MADSPAASRSATQWCAGLCA